jgi:conjugal transfer pilus assembly protein TraK
MTPLPEQVITPNTTTTVLMSGQDINRIVCHLPIQDVIYSPEKGITVRISGADAFLKFLTIQDNGKTLPLKPVELYVVCDGATFTLVATPTDITAQTVRLMPSTTEKVRKSMSYLNPLPHEEKIARILKDVYQETIPAGFIVTPSNEMVDIFQEATIALKRTLRIEGSGLLVKEYAVEPRTNVPEIILSEKDFIVPEITTNPLAVSVDRLIVHQGETMRLFVVEKTVGVE